MVTALNVANNFLQRAFAENIDISPMKLQKLIYFMYREYLHETGKSLFEEHFETWEYGPVLPTVYRHFKGYGSSGITRFAQMENNRYTTISESNEKIADAINYVWDKYKKKNGWELSELTHAKGSAWHKAFEAKRPYLLDTDIKLEETI